MPDTQRPPPSGATQLPPIHAATQPHHFRNASDQQYQPRSAHPLSITRPSASRENSVHAGLSSIAEGQRVGNTGTAGGGSGSATGSADAVHVAGVSSSYQRKASLHSHSLSYQDERSAQLTSSSGLSAVGGPHNPLSSSLRQLRDSYISINGPAQLSGTNSAGGSNNSVEKPTLLLYPRKSVVGSSLRDLAQVRSSIQNIQEGVPLMVGSMASLVPAAPSTGLANASSGSGGIGPSAKISHESMIGSRQSLLMRSINRGMSTTSGFAMNDPRRSMLHVSQDGQIAIVKPGGGNSQGSQMQLNTGQQHGLDAQHSMDQIPIGKRSRPVSIMSIKNLQKIKESLINLATDESSGMPGSGTASAHTSMPPQTMSQTTPSNEYYEYLMLAQRHSSSNFIQKIDSSEVVWESRPMPLKMIGTFLLGDKIGKGAFGKVKEGVSIETLQRVAIKIIGRKRLRKMPNGLENVIREIKMLRRLKHPNVVTLVDVFAKVEDEEGNTSVFPWFTTIEEEPIVWLYEDGSEQEKEVKVLKWYIIFEFCPCSLQTLLEQCEDKKLGLAQAHRYFVQLMEGLRYLHSQSIIHRDIKPGNMLITSDGVLKISDFGVAEQFDPYDGQPMISEAFAGTHQFLSPEIADGATQFDAEKVDVWACGVTLYNMISGRFPFEFDDDGNLLDLYEHIIAGVFEIPKEAASTPDLVNLLNGMLEKDPVKRLSVAQVINHPWTRTVYSSTRKQLPIPTYQLTGPDTPLTPNMPAGTTDGAGTPDSSPVHTGAPADSSVKPDDPANAPADENGGDTDTGSHMDLQAKTRRLQQLQQQHQKRGQDASDGAGVIACQTTLTPFLAAMYQDEIEKSIAETGTVVDLVPEDALRLTASALSLSNSGNGKKKYKIVGWIKHVFGSKSMLSSSPTHGHGHGHGGDK
ncbi:kinase-like domain-containing protein [Entophlyctis helioformis]|nr:kinase-like domain-containing protein [Entophlyctis helioformis]